MRRDQRLVQNFIKLSKSYSNIKRVGGDLSGIWLRRDDIKRIEEDLWSDPSRSSLYMGIYGERPGSIGLLGGVLSHKKTDHIGLCAVSIVVP